MEKKTNTTKYIWYNPDYGVYQMGSKDEFEFAQDLSRNFEEFSLILRLTNESDKMVRKVIEELNKAREELISQDMKAAGREYLIV